MSQVRGNYVLLWRNRTLTTEADSLEDMAAKLTSAASELTAMFRTGKVRLLVGGIEDDRAKLVTDDPDVAERFGFQDAEDFDGNDDDDGEDDSDLDDLDDDTDLYCPGR